MKASVRSLGVDPAGPLQCRRSGRRGLLFRRDLVRLAAHRVGVAGALLVAEVVGLGGRSGSRRGWPPRSGRSRPSRSPPRRPRRPRSGARRLVDGSLLLVLVLGPAARRCPGPRRRRPPPLLRSFTSGSSTVWRVFVHGHAADVPARQLGESISGRSDAVHEQVEAARAVPALERLAELLGDADRLLVAGVR